MSNADGTGERVLVQGGDAINGTPWSPDGTRIAYFEFHSNDVSIVDLATGQSFHVAEGYWPAWLNDHTLIIEMDSCYDPTTEARVAPGLRRVSSRGPMGLTSRRAASSRLIDDDLRPGLEEAIGEGLDSVPRDSLAASVRPETASAVHLRRSAG